MEDEGSNPPENGQHFSGSIPFKNPIQECFCSFPFDSLALGRIPARAELSCITHGQKNHLPALFISRDLRGAACKALSSKTFLLKPPTTPFFIIILFSPGENSTICFSCCLENESTSVSGRTWGHHEMSGPALPHLGPSPWVQELLFSSAWGFQTLLHRAAGVPHPKFPPKFHPKFHPKFPRITLPPWMFILENVYYCKLNVIIRKLEMEGALIALQ